MVETYLSYSLTKVIMVNVKRSEKLGEGWSQRVISRSNLAPPTGR